MEGMNVLRRRKKWEWIGHTLRKDEKYIARVVMSGNLSVQEGYLSGPDKHAEELLFVSR